MYFYYYSKKIIVSIQKFIFLKDKTQITVKFINIVSNNFFTYLLTCYHLTILLLSYWNSKENQFKILTPVFYCPCFQLFKFRKFINHIWIMLIFDKNRKYILVKLTFF